MSEAASDDSFNEEALMRLPQLVSSSQMKQPHCGILNKVTLMSEPQLGSINKAASTQEPQ